MSKLTTLFALALVTPIGAQTAAAAGDATVKGGLDQAVIRRIIQQHIGEVKRCYEGALEKNKDLAGRVVVRFTIQLDGKVTSSGVAETSLGSPPVERCITDAVATWIFPKPRGGQVEVNYPFVFASSPPDPTNADGPKKK